MTATFLVTVDKFDDRHATEVSAPGDNDAIKEALDYLCEAIIFPATGEPIRWGTVSSRDAGAARLRPDEDIDWNPDPFIA